MEALIREEWERRHGPIVFEGKKPIPDRIPPSRDDIYGFNEKANSPLRV